MSTVFDYNLPESLIKSFETSSSTVLFEWQKEILQLDGVLDGSKNLLYSAPTSAGKTLVSDILVGRRVTESKKALIVFPFVAIAREKYNSFRALYQYSQISVGCFAGGSRPPGGLAKNQVIIATIEKGNSILNQLMNENKMDEISCIVIDEIHLVGEANRGFILELLCTKALQYPHIQIIGMSATVPNLSQLGKWLHAEVYRTSFRPVPLEVNLCFKGNFYTIDQNKRLKYARKVPIFPEITALKFDNEQKYILSIILDTIKQNTQAMIFCPTKKWCETIAGKISEQFETLRQCDPTLIPLKDIGTVDNMLQESGIYSTSAIYKLVKSGVGFHHAGLTTDERSVIEASFRQGIIRVLISTTTLSAGVNLPARVVIVRSPFTFGRNVISARVFKQMCGRAGRQGIDTSGHAILMCTQEDNKVARDLISAESETIVSQLSLFLLRRTLLEIIVTKSYNEQQVTKEDVLQFIRSTLHARQDADSGKTIDNFELEPSEIADNNSCPSSMTNQDTNVISCTFGWLEENEFITIHDQHDLHSTKLGEATIAAGMHPDTALSLFDDLSAAKRSLNLETDLHLIYLCTPFQDGAVAWASLAEIILNLKPELARVAQICHIDENIVRKIVRMGKPAKSSDPNMNRKIQIITRFFKALALYELTCEEPLDVVAEKYGMARGTLQALQLSAGQYAGMITAFCDHLAWHHLKHLLATFQSQIESGAPRELLDLLRCQFISARRARCFYKLGFKTLKEITSADEDTIVSALGKMTKFMSKKKQTGEDDISDRVKGADMIVLPHCTTSFTFKFAAEIIINEARLIVEREDQLLSSNRKIEKVGEASFDQTYASVVQQASQYVGSVSQQEDVTSQLPSVSPLGSNTRRHVSKIDTHIEEEFSTANLERKISETSSCDLFRGDIVHSDDDDENAPIVTPTPRVTKPIDLAEELRRERNMQSQMVIQSSTFVPEMNDSHMAADFSQSLIYAHDAAHVNDDVLSIPDSDATNSDIDDDAFQTLVNEDAYTSPVNEQCTNAKIDNQNDASLNTSNSLFESSQEPSQEPTQEPTQVSMSAAKAHRKRKSVEPSSQPKKARMIHPNLDEMEVDMEFDETISEYINKEIKNVHIKTPNTTPKKSKKIVTSVALQLSPRDTTALEAKAINDQTSADRHLNRQIQRRKLFGRQSVGTSPMKRIATPKPPASQDDNHIIIDEDDDTPPIEELYKNKDSNVEKDSKTDSNVEKDSKKDSNVELSENGIRTRIIENSEFQKFIRKKIVTSPAMAVTISDDTIFLCSSPSTSDVVYQVSRNLEVSLIYQLFKNIKIFACFNFFANMERLIELNVYNRNGVYFDVSLAYWALDSTRALTPAGNPVSMCDVLRELCERSPKSQIAALANGDPNASCLAISKCYEQLSTMFTERSLTKNFLDYEMKHAKVMFDMEKNGFGFSNVAAEKMVKSLEAGKGKTEKAMRKLTKDSFPTLNLNHLADQKKLIFDILKLTPSDSAATGKPAKSLSKEILEDLASQHPGQVPQLILDYRRLDKAIKDIKSYLEFTTDNRVYAKVHLQNLTGRITVIDPGLQMVQNPFMISLAAPPIKVRNLFRISSTRLLVAADYCQLELRMLAHLSKDEKLLAAFNAAEDPFISLGRQWLNKTDITKDERKRVKEMIYGTIYGMGPRGLSQKLQTTKEAAQVLMDNFRAAYPAMAAFLIQTISNADKNKYCQTLSGRRRYFKKFTAREERVAINTTVQGSAADFVKMATVKLIDVLTRKFPTNPPKLVMQLHDEVIFEISKTQLKEVETILYDVLTMKNHFSVKFDIKVRSGMAWSSLDD